ncbi:serine hydrolase [Candidatus Daviesbacteria bacterium]|nr:serine hydrolase [Candidatus Daviesbacteria bacterium]
MKHSAQVATIAVLLVINFVIYSKLLLEFNLLPKSAGRLGLVGFFDFSKSFSFNFQDPKLARIIRQKLDGQVGEYAIVVKGLSSGSKLHYSLNEKKVLPSGSLYKLFLMAATLKQVEEGKLREDQVLTSSINHLKDVLGFEEFGYDSSEGDEISYSVSDALTRVATLSDNYASILLAEKVGWDNIQKQANMIGAESTTIKDPISTNASDITLFFEKLYKKEIVSEKTSEKLIELLSSSRLNNRIPAKLPKDIKIAHKTAELSKLRHDAGIVFLDNEPYLIVLMSSNVKYEDEAVELLADISKEVFDYFSKTR